MTDPNDLLMGSGGRAAKFEKTGDAVDGVVMRVDSRQRTEIGGGQPMTWPDGNPKMQLVVTLLTDSQEDDEDDGMRNLYVPIPSAMQAAIADAVRKAGQHGIGDGGTLAVTFTGTKKAATKGYSPQKLYSARYSAPTVSMENNSGHEDDESPF